MKGCGFGPFVNLFDLIRAQAGFGPVKKSSAGPSPGSQTFLTSGTFTVPAGVTKVTGWIAAGGGGGGASGGNGGGGGGGGGDAFAFTNYAVTPGAMISVTVGAGSNIIPCWSLCGRMAGGCRSVSAERPAG